MPFLKLRTHLFYPLTLTMPIQNMLFGSMTLQARWEKAFKMNPGFTDLWIEPTLLPDRSLIDAISNLDINQVLIQDSTILAACLDKKHQNRFNQNHSKSILNDLDMVQYKNPCEMVTSLQFMIDHNGSQITKDWASEIIDSPLSRHPDYNNTFVGPGTNLSGVVIDDTQGPVIIREGVKILPGARIMGPIILLPDAIVKMGAELYPGSTIGSHATVNGEIKNSIIHEFSAKGHAGYLGDSVLGRWNNFGAGTTVSNVSNTFSHIQFEDWNTRQKIELEGIKRGLVTGDFVKLGIMSKIYRGTSIGSFSSITTGNAITGNIPEFTWWTEEQMKRYHTEQLRTHCRRQMVLQNKIWSEEWEMALSLLLKNNPLNTNSIS